MFKSQARYDNIFKEQEEWRAKLTQDNKKPTGIQVVEIPSIKICKCKE